MYDHLYDRSVYSAYPPSRLRAGAACVTHDRIRVAKRRNIIGPSIYCYITDIIVVMRVDGLEQVGVSECVIAVWEAGYLP